MKKKLMLRKERLRTLSSTDLALSFSCFVLLGSASIPSGSSTRKLGSRGRPNAAIAARVIVRNTRNQTPIELGCTPDDPSFPRLAAFGVRRPAVAHLVVDPFLHIQTHQLVVKVVA